MAEKLSIHDTCGVNNLHGMPGVLAGIIGAIVTSLATVDVYGNRYILLPSLSFFFKNLSVCLAGNLIVGTTGDLFSLDLGLTS